MFNEASLIWFKDEINKRRPKFIKWKLERNSKRSQSENMKIKFYSNLINLGRDERNLTVQLRVQINKDKVLISSSEIL